MQTGTGQRFEIYCCWHVNHFDAYPLSRKPINTMKETELLV